MASLQVISALIDAGSVLNQLKKKMTKLPQSMVNVACRHEYTENNEIKTAIREAEQRLKGKGRVLLRPSGTEPVIRVMVEGEDSLKVHELAGELAEVVGHAVN